MADEYEHVMDRYLVQKMISFKRALLYGFSYHLFRSSEKEIAGQIYLFSLWNILYSLYES